MTDGTPTRDAGGSLRVAAVMDEFTEGSFRDECTLLQLTPAGILDQLEAFGPQLLFIESAWRGKDGSWHNTVPRRPAELRAAIDWCKQRGVPTVFWNKEDPVHFGTFLSTAALFDHVFTTDIDTIPRYRTALGHENVHLLPFASQPAMFNPMDGEDRLDAFCFAGAYYARYPDRNRDFNGFVRTLSTLHPFLVYDRNHGKDDPAYSFPDRHAPLILGTLPYERVQRAYKGYTYTINMNSVTQSQTMCARRVFELLASNAVVVSNFSRAVRALLGDLVITTSDADEARRRVERFSDRHDRRRLQLAGLRKAMWEHTYAERLGYVAEVALGLPAPSPLPPVEAVAPIRDASDVPRALAAAARQTHAPTLLTLRCTADTLDAARSAVSAAGVAGIAVRVVDAEAITRPEVDGFVALLHPDDHHGPSYLLDLCLGTRYSDASVLGKLDHYVASDDGTATLVEEGGRYRSCGALPPRRAIVRSDLLARRGLAVLDDELLHGTAASLDEFSYCANGAELSDETLAVVHDLPDLRPGVPLAEVRALARAGAHDTAPPDATVHMPADVVEESFAGLTGDGVIVHVHRDQFLVESTRTTAEHTYLWSSTLLDPARLDLARTAPVFLDTTGQVDLHLGFRFRDEQGALLSTALVPSQRNTEVEVPKRTHSVQLGLRVAGTGTAVTKRIVLQSVDLSPERLLLDGDHLVITNQYPDYDDLYRNAFVHGRVRAYEAAGLATDVVRFAPDSPTCFREFEDVDVVEGGEHTLEVALRSTRASSVSVHFLLPDMWAPLEHHLAQGGTAQVWIHGFEVQPWHRRPFAYNSDADLEAAKRSSERRTAFWRQVLTSDHERLRFVFVSRYLAEQTAADLDIELPTDRVEVIHNPIDTDLFGYRPRTAEDRLHVLSVRPYASRTYANDLSVAAILALRDEPWFDDVRFTMVGDGALFEETLAPLQELDNVRIHRGFITQTAIARLHVTHGVLLCPSRMDTHGVSRDEAMASGLVPIVSRVAAVPEFVDDECAFITEPDDAAGIADALRTIVADPDRYLRMSAAAAARVRAQAGAEQVIPHEIALITRP